MIRGYRMGSKSVKDARRPSKNRDPKIIYFIFSEGFETEQIYFETLAKHDLLKDNVEIKPCKRLKINSGESNQKKVVQHIKEYLDKIQNIESRDRKKIRYYVEKIENNTHNYLDMIDLMEILGKIKTDVNFSETESIIEQVKAIGYISGYDKCYDKICIILDRDSESFSEDQYDEALQICKNQGYIFGISNPNFEFFLLLHLKDLSEFSQMDLRNNKINGKSGLTAKHLKEILAEKGISYKKNNFNANFFIDNFGEGIKNSNLYEKQEEQLKYKIGTNLFNIISNIIN